MLHLQMIQRSAIVCGMRLGKNVPISAWAEGSVMSTISFPADAATPKSTSFAVCSLVPHLRILRQHKSNTEVKYTYEKSCTVKHQDKSLVENLPEKTYNLRKRKC